MNKFTFFIAVFFLIFSMPLVNAVSFFEDTTTGVFNYYTANPNPIFEVNFESRSSQVLVINSVEFNRVNRDLPSLPMDIEPFQSVELTFPLPSDLQFDDGNSQLEVWFDIFARGVRNNSRDVEIAGDPSRFVVHYISEQTQVTHYSSQKNTQRTPLSQFLILRGDDEFVEFHFNNPIVEYEVVINSQSVASRSINSRVLDDIPSTVRVETSQLSSGTHPVRIFAKDITGREFTQEFDLTVANPSLRITRVFTNEDDSSLGYYFNRRFEGLDVYTSQREFALTFETNFNASCYLQRVEEFRESFNVNPITNQVTFHELPIELFDRSDVLEGIWVMCEDVNSPFREEERVYLSEEMFGQRELFNVRFLSSRDDFEIINARPEGIVTYSPITIEATTNYPSFCEFQILDSNSWQSLNTDSSSNFLNHRREGVLSNQEGEIEVVIRCRDQLFNTDTTSLNIEIDPQRPTQLVSWNPRFSSTEFVDLEIEVSDSNARCGIVSQFSQIGSNVNSGSLIEPTRVEGSSIFFNRVGPLTEGRNEIPLRCTNSQGVIENLKINIVYDPTPPTISNVLLFNEVTTGPTEFFSNSIYMRIEVESSSEGISTYSVRFPNSQIFVNSTSSQIEITENFSQDSSLQVQAIDELGRESTIFTQNFFFDTQPPEIRVLQGDSSTTRVIECSDDVSGCYKVEYGTSSIEGTCMARTRYSNNSQIDVFGKNFICVRAFDNAGNLAELTKNLTSRTSAQDQFMPPPRDDTSPRDEFDDGFTSPIDNETDGFTDDPIDPISPITPPIEESGFNWILLSAFAFILLMAGGGGYYAYRKGYLDKQLIAMGVIKPKKNDNSQGGVSGAVPYSQIPRKDLNSSKLSSSVASGANKYDSHLSKLNDFINSTIKKDSKMFDEFSKNNSKGKTQSFKDTLIKNQKDLKDEKESFEEFYKQNASKKKSDESSSKKK